MSDDLIPCAVCGTPHPRGDLDRLLWCPDCLERARAQARRYSWMVGIVVAVALAIWVVTSVRPTVIVGGWIGVILGGFWVGARVSREVFMAVFRSRWEREA